MYNMNDVLHAASILGISYDKFSPKEFLDGINIELEHGTINSNTNVTNDDLIIISKIALAHLNEFPDYYNKDYGLKIYEAFLKENYNYVIKSFQYRSLKLLSLFFVV